MGLAERRLAEQIKTEQVPQFLDNLQAAMSFAPEVEIDWASFMAYNEYPLNRMQSNVFATLVEAMSRIGQDAMGREALAESIHKIVIKNAATREEMVLNLSDKTLYLTVALAEDVYATHGSAAIVSYLEPKL
jgi:hypothetical protein